MNKKQAVISLLKNMEESEHQESEVERLKSDLRRALEEVERWKDSCFIAYAKYTPSTKYNFDGLTADEFWKLAGEVNQYLGERMVLLKSLGKKFCSETVRIEILRCASLQLDPIRYLPPDEKGASYVKPEIARAEEG